MGFLAAAVVGSAFCLFLIQPMMAKKLLPVFGGSAAVWAVCLVFYQSMLLLGYLYAHAVARRLPPRGQAAVHAVLCGLALLALPHVDAPPMAPGAGSPAAGIVIQLAMAIGLPYLMLSATSPLLQHWCAKLYPGRQAYRLFAWSNLSCVVALVAFPFWLEPRWGWGQIANLWKWAFAAAAAFHVLSAWLIWRRRLADKQAAPTGPDRVAVPRRSVALWLYLAFLGSGLLVSVTDHLCLVVAPFPMLWVLPLLLYLLSFVVTFESDRYRRAWGVPTGFAGLLSMAWALTYLEPARMLGSGVAIFSLGLFTVCLMVHGELAAGRPPERHLTSFYIAMAAGGALGSVFVALIAPLVFKQMVEMPLLMALTALTALMLVYGRSIYTDALAAVATVLLVVAVGANLLALQSQVVEVDRNFYGSMRVTESVGPGGSGRLRTMVHGSVNHGSQFQDEERRRIPLTYYTFHTGVGQLLSRPGTDPRKVGLVGLGAGVLAAYGRMGDVFRFYEINPLVVKLATTRFSYISDSPAKVDVVLGDARIMLSRQPDQNFDVLVVDAFTGDSVPVHLLTREAMAVYARHLKPGGVLALHLSNLHLDLTKVAGTLAHEMDWRASVIGTPADGKLDSVGAVWVMMSRGESGTAPASGPGPLWTDEHSSLMHVIR